MEPQQKFKRGPYRLERNCFEVVVYFTSLFSGEIRVVLRERLRTIGEAGHRFAELKNEIKAGTFSAGVRKFLHAAQSFRSSDQMIILRGQKFFSNKELIDGLKRWIHLHYIECA